MPRHRAPQRSPRVNLASLRLILALRNRDAMASTGAADRRGHCLPKTRQLRHADQVDLAVLVALKTCAHAAAGLSRQAARASCVRSRGFGYDRPGEPVLVRGQVRSARGALGGARHAGWATRPGCPLTRFRAALAGCNQQPVTVGGDLHVGQGVAVATARRGSQPAANHRVSSQTPPAPLAP